MEIRRYTAEAKAEWDTFVENSKNGTFLLKRDYMDYHSDRFNDFSLMFYQDEKLYALLPANHHDDILYSHQGLTYGGLVMSTKCTASCIVALFHELNAYLLSQGIKRVLYKPIPADYHKYPAQEDLYAIFNACGASLKQRNLSCVVDLSEPIKWNRDRKYGVNRAFRSGIVIEESQDMKAFWRVLEDNLHNKYGATPVHTVEEIMLLKEKFPQNIRLVTATLDGEVVAGTILYLMYPVAHTQYISASPKGKELRALDAMFKFILDKCVDYRYFDFGTSNEGMGRRLNESLIYQKEGFGGRGICYDTYEWEVK